MTTTSQSQGFITPVDMTENQINELGETLAVNVVNRLIKSVPLPLSFPYSVHQLSDALADVPLPMLISHIDECIQAEFTAQSNAISDTNSDPEKIVLEMMYQGMLQVVKSQILDLREIPL